MKTTHNTSVCNKGKVKPMEQKLNNRKIEKDWLNAFPSFKKIGARDFVKRTDCFLMGIYLYPISSHTKYRICFYLYNLMIDLALPAIPLTMDYYVKNEKGAEDNFSMQEHKEKFEKIITECKHQIPLLKEESVTSSALIQYMRRIIDGDLNTDLPLASIVLLNYWCDNLEQVEKEIKNGKTIISQWEHRITKSFGGADGWEHQVRSLMNKDLLNATVEKQCIKYKLENLKNYKLII